MPNSMKVMSQYLPATGSRLLVGIVVVAAAIYGLLAVVLTFNIIRAPLALLGVLFFATLSCGMWRLKQWARWITVGAIWIGIIVIPIGVLNPFAAMDWEGGAPRWEVLASWIALGVASGLFVLHVLGKHKGEFKW